MASLTYSSPFPIVFICDYYNRDQQIPEYDPSSITATTDSCISVRTVSDVDGEVTIFLDKNFAGELPDGAVEVYSGHIEAPGGKIAVVDSEDNKLLESEMVGMKPFVRILVDDIEHPTTLWIEARPVRAT